LALENERICRQTLKLGYGQIDNQQLFELKAKGVAYDPAAGELSYVPNVCVFAATRPLDGPTFTYLSKSGYFSRYHVLQFNIDDQEVSEHLHQDFIIDQDTLNLLKQINQKLSSVKVQKVKRPPPSLMKEIYDAVEDIVRDEISNDPRRKLSEVINPRLKGDIIREIIGHCFLRIASQNDYRDIEIVECNEEDAHFILGRIYHFVNFALKPLIAEDITTRTMMRSKKDQTIGAILDFLSDGAEHSRKEVLQYVQGKINISTAMTDIVLKELLTERTIQQPSFGFYKSEGGV